MTRVGFMALARTTFDVPYAQSQAASALQALENITELEVVGDSSLATDDQAVVAAATSLAIAELDAQVVFQATFADSTLISGVASRMKVPLVLWATTEERTGGRLRLNSFCGINLAAYVLARAGVDYRWVLREVDDPKLTTDILAAVSGPRRQNAGNHVVPLSTSQPVNLTGRTIGLIGDRQTGFEPSDFSRVELDEIFGVSVDRVELEDWFTRASAANHNAVSVVRDELDQVMIGLDGVDAEALDRSLRLYLGESSLAEEGGWDAVATRCWPECFTEFGGAACNGNSMMTSAGKPGCCEADVYGNLTAMLLQELSGQPAVVTDLVDLDRSTNTAVFWHCGLAPREMVRQGEKSVATIHSNRAKPLLNEFAFRPGEVTIARVSQSQNTVRLVVGRAEMLDDPLPFSGTSGVARLGNGVDATLETIMSHGLEHHYGIAYGDLSDGLVAYAQSRDLEVILL